MKKFQVFVVLSLILSLMMCTTVSAKNSEGIQHVQNDMNKDVYVHLEAEDLGVLEGALVDLSDYYKKAIEESYRNGYEDHIPPEADFDWIYHVHQGDTGLDVIPDGYTHYSLTEPGGCFVLNSSKKHTHNQPEACSKKTCNSTKAEVLSYHEYWDGCDWHGWGTQAGKQLRCQGCGKEYSYTWQRGETQPEFTKCSNTIYTCGSPNNTWILKCGKKTTDKIGATIVWEEKKEED